MRKGILCFFVLGMFFFSSNAMASYIMIPASTGAIDDDNSNCEVYTGSGNLASKGTADCTAVFPITIESGKTLSSVMIYYYDSSGSSFISATLYRLELASDVTYSTLDSDSDSSFAGTSNYSMTLSYGSSVSASYAYYVTITVDYGTVVNGMRVYYY